MQIFAIYFYRQRNLPTDAGASLGFLPRLPPRFVDEVALDVDAPATPTELLLGFKSSPDKLLPPPDELGAFRFFDTVPPLPAMFGAIPLPIEVSG